ncbi:MAG TPA: hypothetical protein VHK91_10510 [Flavisolibacter sp.]|jgi:hypothetical protein|nr:hypothetical protein [Flavisolibacter sp.]
MNHHYQLTDRQLEEQFEDGTFDPSLFSHEAHLRLGWIHIRKYGLLQAEENLCQQIRSFAEQHGAAMKFHTTVTIAAAKALYHFMQKSQSDTFFDFIHEFPRLQFHFREVLGHHYGFDVFREEEARLTYIEPDLLPFS